MKNLYFIAVIPHKDLQEKVRLLKLQMKDRYRAKHALKSPAHITLQIPFRRADGFERELTDELDCFAADQKGFTVELSGFGSFPPRVLYINVLKNDELQKLFSGLKETLTGRLGFSEKEVMNNFKPHMTLATRDLTEEMYDRAWKNYRSKNFSGIFKVHSIFLLKHNGKDWDIFREFSFS